MAKVSIIPAATATVTQEDVTIELLCFNHAAIVLGDRREAGRLKGYVEATLAANPDLADLGPMLPLGRKVKLPEFVVAAADVQTVRLWD